MKYQIIRLVAALSLLPVVAVAQSNAELCEDAFFEMLAKYQTIVSADDGDENYLVTLDQRHCSSGRGKPQVNLNTGWNCEEVSGIAPSDVDFDARLLDGPARCRVRLLTQCGVDADPIEFPTLELDLSRKGTRQWKRFLQDDDPVVGDAERPSRCHRKLCNPHSLAHLPFVRYLRLSEDFGSS